MTKTYSSKYFQNRLKALRVLISQSKGYKTVEELFMSVVVQNKEQVANQNEGR